jgi:hypothetical protein
MGFRIRPGKSRQSSSANSPQIFRTLSGSAASVRAIVDATENAVYELQAELASEEIGSSRSESMTREELEAELTRTLLTRAKDLKRQAQELMTILERAGQQLGDPASEPRDDSAQPLPFNRRSTDPGSADRLNGELPPSVWDGPERRQATADAKMPNASTGNGKLSGDNGSKES